MFIHGGGSATYEIQKSLRFRSAASAYLNRTNGVTGNRLAWTISCWVKKSGLAADQVIFMGGNGGTDYSVLLFTSGDALQFSNIITSATNSNKVSTALFRDPSAWYHIVLTYDSANGTAADRVRLYVNGVRLTSFSASTDASASAQSAIGANTLINNIGKNSTSAIQYLNGYVAEVNFIDGQALDSSSFGQTDVATGSWVPKAYSGTYGTNGFYLGFDDGTNTTTLGDDQSSNSNSWTLNNISLTAGVTYDWMVDTPTNNYTTLNPLLNQSGLSPATISIANMRHAGTAATAKFSAGTMLVSTGKWYFEATVNSVSGGMYAGVRGLGSINATYYQSNGATGKEGVAGSSFATYTTNDIIGVALDRTSNSVAFYKNNTLQTTITGLTSTEDLTAFFYTGGTDTWDVNFGQRPFTYTPPSGYLAMNTVNLPTPTSKRGDDHFFAKTRTGTGASYSVTGLRFSPDFVWTKGRSGATDHALYDTPRGVQKQIESNTTGAETTETTGLTAFNSDGFTGGALAQMNTSAATYIDWMWNESVAAGMDVVTFTGNNTARTIAHGLGVVPAMIIFKSRTTAATNWPVYHKNQSASPQLGTIFLNLTNAYAATTIYNNTAPTSSVFSAGSGSSDLNANAQDYVAYLFAEVEGFSKFGSYTGNGSADGPFVWCGFRPRYILHKRIDSTEAWVVYDTARDTTNPLLEQLVPNGAGAGANTVGGFDIVSNGFKVRTSTGGGNASGGTYIFAAFAEMPFKYANAR